MKKTTGIPVMILAGLLPLAFCFHIETIEFSQYPWFPNQGYWLDLFLYGKSQLLQMLSLLMAGILIVHRIKKREKCFDKERILLNILAILFVLSAFFSKYPRESFEGTIEQYESIGVLLGYVILCAFCIRFAQSEENISCIVKALLFGLLISCVLGLFQLVQLDLWSSEMGKNILIPEQFAELRDGLRFGEDTNNFRRVYMTLYNSNYAGIYLAMLFPFLIVFENKFLKLLRIPVVLCLVGTMSKTAWISVAIVVILDMWMKQSFIEKKKKWILTGCLLTIVGLCMIAVLPIEQGVSSEKKLQEVEPTEEWIRIVYQGNTLYFSEYPKDDGVTYRLLDEKGEKVKLSWIEERGELDPIDPRYDGLHFKVYLKEGISYALFRYENVVFRFTDDLGTGKYEYISINGKPDELETAKTAEIFPDSFLNGRGYIWNRVIPIIGKNVLLGAGPDSFLQVFPQDDYVTRANLGYGFFSEILTNAHSFYFQMILQTGVLSFGCFLILIIRYLGTAWKYYSRKANYTAQEKIGICCFLGCISFLICGCTFASSVCTTPIFMILLGTGMGIMKNNNYQKNSNILGDYVD